MTLPSNFSNPLGGPASTADPKQLHDHWKGVVAFGLVSAVLGLVALALTVSATLASVLMIGVFMIVAGLAELALGFRMRSWRRFLVWEVAGVVYLCAGAFAMLQPEVATVVITLLLGAGLVATGLLRVIFGLQLGASPNRSLLLLSGTVTGLLGLVIVLGWPANSALVLGTLLGIDLLFNGIAWTMFGLRARHPV